MSSDHKYSAILVCDLQKAAEFYEVDIDEIELKEYYTNFEVNQHETQTLEVSINCKGCNEIITAKVKGWNRRHDLRTSSILSEVIFVLIFALLIAYFSITSFPLSPIGFYTIFALGLIMLSYNIYRIFYGTRTELDTLFFWHRIKEIGEEN